MDRSFTVTVAFEDGTTGEEADREAENIRTVLEAQLGSWQRMYLHFSEESPDFVVSVK